jgi:hypothetical protein
MRSCIATCSATLTFLTGHRAKLGVAPAGNTNATRVDPILISDLALYLVELDQDRLGANVGLADFLRAERPLEPALTISGRTSEACNGARQLTRHLLAGTMNPVSILDYTHQNSHA